MTILPQVSVILPVYNRRRPLVEAARSVLSQDYPALELIIVDDASEPTLHPVVQALSDARVRYLRRPCNGGPAAARNTGIAAATGTLIAFQDSDDLWHPGKLRRQVEVLSAAGPEIGFVYTDICRSRDGVDTIFPGARLRQTSGDLREVALGDGMAFAYVQSWLVYKAALDAVGGFDPDFRLWEDWELCIRLTQRFHAIHVPGVFVTSTRGTDSVSADLSLWLPALRRIVALHGNGSGRGMARLYYMLARFEFLSGDRHYGWRALLHSLRLRPTPKTLALGLLAVSRLDRPLLLGRNPATAGG